MPSVQTQSSWLAELLEIEGDGERETRFEGQPHFHNEELLPLIHAELIRYLYSDQARARRAAALAELAAQVVQDCASLGIWQRCRGNLLYAEAHYAESVAAYEESIRLFQQAGREAEAGRVYFGGLQALIYLGQYDEAHRWAEEARVRLTRANDHRRLARLNLNIGNLYYRQDQYQQAMEHYVQAREQLQTSDQPQDYAAVLSNSAVCLSSMGRFSEALSNYREAQEWCRTHHLDQLSTAADYNVAYLHYLRGEYRRAAELYRLSRERSVAVGDHYHRALCDLDESEMLLELNMASQAQVLASQAADGFRQLNMPYEYAKALAYGGLARFQRGDSRLALSKLREARRVFKKEGNAYWLGLLDLYRAIILEKERQWEHSRRLAESARSVLAPYSLTGKFALCNLLLARLSLVDNQYARALALLQEADGSALSPALKCHVSYLLGRLSEKWDEGGAASRFYAEALAAVERTRFEFWNRELRISYLQDKTTMYEAFVGLALKSGGVDGEIRAFDLVQRAKSRTLLESMDSGSASPDGESRQALVEATRNLNAAYRQLEIAAARPSHPAKAGELKSLRTRIQSNEAALAKAWNEHRQTPDPAFEIESLDVLRKAIPAGTSLIELFVIGESIHAWLLRSDEFSHQICGAAEAAHHALRLLQFQLGKFTLGEAYLHQFGSSIEHAVEAHLSELYDILIAPLRHKLATEHLIFAPASFLHHVPFYALRDRDGRSLLEDFVVSVIPSASVYSQCLRRSSKGCNGSLILAAPDAAAPRVADEGSAVAAILPDAELLLGEEATVEALFEKSGGRRYIHIAAHGLQRRDNPVFSAILMGNSQLRLIDLDGLQLCADLVTLSGCSTGVSVVTGADELLGLMRGMLTAGAKNLLATLWDVSDSATSSFMVAFYQNLFRDPARSAARALRATMFEMRQRQTSIYFWAGFQVLGIG